MAGVALFLAKVVLLLLKLKTSSFLSPYWLYIVHKRATMWPYCCFTTKLLDECIIKKEASQLSHKDISPRKSEVINFRWVKVNAANIKRSQVGVFNTLEFLEKHSGARVDRAIFIDVTPDSVAFSSLLKSLHVFTVGLFQEQGGFRTEETVRHICPSKVF